MFTWKNAPLSSPLVPVLAGLVYLLGIFYLLPGIVLPEDCRDFLKKSFVVHNASLSFLSLLLFAGCLYEVVQRSQKEGTAEWMLCETATESNGPLFLWTYLFYVSKYVEMLDTVFVVLTGSRQKHMLLHCLHHAVIPGLVWGWLEYQMTYQWIGLLFNSAVHIPMYSYFAVRICIPNLPKYLANCIFCCQISQFATAILVGMIKGPHLQDTECRGKGAMVVNLLFYMVLLVLFVQMKICPKSDLTPVPVEATDP